MSAETHIDPGLSKRQTYDILRAQLELERSSFIPLWRDVADHTVPRRPRFTNTEVNRGERRNQKIKDSTATYSLRTLSAGMSGGITSQYRQWFGLGTPNSALSAYAPVKLWLDVVTERMRSVFLGSNLYNALAILYTDLGAFGTAAMIVEEDHEEVLRCSVFPIGSYMLGVDSRGKVNIFHREFKMTVRQLVQKFGRKSWSQLIDWSKFSDRVKQLYLEKKFDVWIDVCHVICPNEDYDRGKAESKYKKFASCYYEKGGTQAYDGAPVNQDRFLRESGYDYFPVLAPRWSVTGEDTYGTGCPGIDTLGDNKQLQNGEVKIAEAIEKLLKPPMVGPATLKQKDMSILPGGMTFADEREGMKGFRPAFQVDPRVQEMEFKQEQVRFRIKRGFFEDLFLLVSSLPDRDRTAKEITVHEQERLIVLGPVLAQLNQDLLDPLIDIAFDLMLAADMIPPPPMELQGMPLKVEYTSVMAQAQKLMGITGLERFANFVGNLMATVPEVKHKVDWLQLVEQHGDSMGVSPKIIRTEDAVAEILQAEAEGAAAATQNMQAREGAATLKDLSQTPMEDGTALSSMLRAALGNGALNAAGGIAP